MTTFYALLMDNINFYLYELYRNYPTSYFYLAAYTLNLIVSSLESDKTDEILIGNLEALLFSENTFREVINRFNLRTCPTWENTFIDRSILYKRVWELVNCTYHDLQDAKEIN